MSRAIVVLNAGSSSVKFALFSIHGDSPVCVYRGQVADLGINARLSVWDAGGSALASHPLPADASHENAISAILDWIEGHDKPWQVVAAGHRVVHGGDRHAQPVLIDDDVLAELEALCPLAPLHQPHNLAAIRAVRRHRRDLPQSACFDTGFHQSQPAIARLFPLPGALSESGIRRYGFHGLSYESIAQRLPEVIGDKADGRVVVAHLGNGSSMCAMLGRQSVASTMGFTALDGLMMGTRSGAIDPGVLLYLMDQKGMSSRELTRMLYHESGLLGVSGISQDMRTLLASKEPKAGLAVELYVYRASRELGSLAAALGGLDALVFTAGIGENASSVRAAICRQAGWLGVELDPDANASHGPKISTGSSRVTAAVIPTDEEAMITQHTVRLLRGR